MFKMVNRQPDYNKDLVVQVSSIRRYFLVFWRKNLYLYDVSSAFIDIFIMGLRLNFQYIQPFTWPDR